MATLDRPGGCRLYYEVHGPAPAERTPLALLEGSGGDIPGWRRNLPRLAAARRVIAFDFRGNGRSGAPDEPMTMATFVDDTLALLDHLEVPVAHVYGQSFGGMVAQELALTHPERVRSIVLAATNAGPRHAVHDRDAAKVPKDRPYLALYSEAFAREHPDHVAEDILVGSQHPQHPHAARRQWEAMQAWDAFDRLGSIHCPTLVLHGSEDRLVSPADARLLAERIPGAELVLLEGAGHVYHSEQPEAADAAVLSFVDRIDEVWALIDERQRAREGRDFATADSLRERIHEAGFAVVDSPAGSILERARAAERTVAQPVSAPAPQPIPSGDVVNLLYQPASAAASVHWLFEGWPEDVVRGIESFRAHVDADVQHVVVDTVGAAATGWPEDVEVIRLIAGTGWGAARNAGLIRSLGRIVLVVDGSVEAAGEVLAPLADALGDAGVGVAGPFGIVTDDLREFRESDGPDVDAIEGYLMAFRRELLVDGLRFDEKFKFYRTADVELSFQVKARGLRAVVVPLPVKRHEHRMWANTPESRRAALSKRNYYRFLDRWRGRFDLTVVGSSGGDP